MPSLDIQIDKREEWLHVKYVPKKIIEGINDRRLQDNQQYSHETYFLFSDYKSIAEHPGNSVLNKRLTRKADGLSWLGRLNKLRRDPSHPEKPAPSEADTVFFENCVEYIVNELISPKEEGS